MALLDGISHFSSEGGLGDSVSSTGDFFITTLVHWKNDEQADRS